MGIIQGFRARPYSSPSLPAEQPVAFITPCTLGRGPSLRRSTVTSCSTPLVRKISAALDRQTSVGPPAMLIIKERHGSTVSSSENITPFQRRPLKMGPMSRVGGWGVGGGGGGGGGASSMAGSSGGLAPCSNRDGDAGSRPSNSWPYAQDYKDGAVLPVCVGSADDAAGVSGLRFYPQGRVGGGRRRKRRMR